MALRRWVMAVMRATGLSEGGVYAFDVAVHATKAAVAAAIREVYQVTPRKVTFVAVPRKMVRQKM